MTDEISATNATTTSLEVTDLVAAGEGVFKSVTGRKMNDNQQKVSDGITRILDGLLPSISRVFKKFSLQTVVAGFTKTLEGIALVITGAKTLNTPKPETTDTATTGTTIQ